MAFLENAAIACGFSGVSEKHGYRSLIAAFFVVEKKILVFGILMLFKIWVNHFLNLHLI